ncbi:MAG TPA: UDP-N-acetylglucosamine 2-epimerase (non-hydrolyzing) [Gemmatimonadales bacterium]|nr:UDP-N-acetylglucosamine 2-epimerase (non-hydrolyzing) [Gemmatimonadales bacterium]
MLIVSVVGARPNFMKLGPVARELASRRVRHVVVHTGQHYDGEMSDAFFRDLDLPHPDHHLAVGPGSHTFQTAAVMQRLEPVLENLRPDLVLVYGDVNSTLGASLTAAKLGLRVGHVEAGLRSRDRTMPEELNRIVTDHLADLLFAPSDDAVDNLRAEGIADQGVHLVGNVMIDTLCQALPRARALEAPGKHGLDGRAYVVATLHRPSNVDHAGTLRELLETLRELGQHTPVLFPVHPRTQARMASLGLRGDGLRLCPPLGYVEMLGLVASSSLVITDSGGLQEETTYLGIPCLTARPTTERPITCTRGTNRLVPSRRSALLTAARDALRQGPGARPTIQWWDGRAAQRLVQVVCETVPAARRSDPRVAVSLSASS